MDSSIYRSNCHKAPQATPCGRQKSRRRRGFQFKTHSQKNEHASAVSSNILIIILFFVEAKPVQRIPFAWFNTALARAGAHEVPFRIAAAVFPPAPSALRSEEHTSEL